MRPSRDSGGKRGKAGVIVVDGGWKARGNFRSVTVINSSVTAVTVKFTKVDRKSQVRRQVVE